MAPATALCFALLAASLVLQRWAPDLRGPRLAQRGLALAAAAISVLVLGGFLGLVGFSVDRLLFPRLVARVPAGWGVMSSVTAILLVLLALCLLLPRRGAGAMGMVVVAAGTALITGYIYGTPYLYDTDLVPPALPTSLAFVGLGLASVLSSDRDAWPVRLFVGTGVETRLLRRLLPICALVILAHAWVGSLPFLRSRDRALLSALLLVVALAALLWLVARAAGQVGREADQAMGERWIAEAALQTERSLLRDLIDHLPFAVFIKDRDSRFVAANAEAARLAGVATPADLIGKTDFDFFPEGSARAHYEIEQGIMRTGEPMVGRTAERYTSTGSLLTEGSKYPLRDAGGEITGIIGVVNDVTATRRTQEALARATSELQEREELHRILFDAAADAMLFHDERGILLDANRAACERLGYSTDELKGMPLAAIDTPEYAARVAGRMRDLFERGSALFESAHLTRAGRVIPVEVHARVVEYRGRRVVFSVSRDISERKAAERALRAQEERARQGQKLEAIGRLAGGVAHDFNNMLTVMTGYSDLLLEVLGPSHPARSEVMEIRTAADRASSLTRQLLAFSRKQILHPEPIDTNDVLRGMHKLLRRLIGEDVDLDLRLGVIAGFAVADRNQIEQVIVNLVVNGRDAMPRGGRLVLETSVAQMGGSTGSGAPDLAAGPYIVVSVTDTGTGIAPEDLPLIFEPFYTTKDPGKGTGLGLATAYGIVRQSGGIITVYSEPGRGSTFRVYLPLVSTAPSTRTAESRPTAAQGTETVLIVEDEESVRGFAERVFRDRGYTVIAARNGADALDRASSHEAPVELLITDVVMPGMGGRELANRLMTVRPSLKVLYVSGYTEDSMVHRGVLEPGVRFLAKPYSATTILAVARDLLDSE
jgi:PAS domain S-box-containing protein